MKVVQGKLLVSPTTYSGSIFSNNWFWRHNQTCFILVFLRNCVTSCLSLKVCMRINHQSVCVLGWGGGGGGQALWHCGRCIKWGWRVMGGGRGGDSAVWTHKKPCYPFLFCFSCHLPFGFHLGRPPSFFSVCQRFLYWFTQKGCTWISILRVLSRPPPLLPLLLLERWWRYLRRLLLIREGLIQSFVVAFSQIIIQDSIHWLATLLGTPAPIKTLQYNSSLCACVGVSLCLLVHMFWCEKIVKQHSSECDNIRLSFRKQTCSWRQLW